MADLEKTKRIQQEQEVEFVHVGWRAKLKQWWRTLWREEWELTVYFIAETKFFEFPDADNIIAISPFL